MSILSNEPPVDNEETYDLLKDDTEEKEGEESKEKKETSEEDKPEGEETSEKEEEIDELAEIEKDLEDELDEDKDEEDELELVTPVRRAEILKKFPTLFKDFPYLEKAYYRDRKYSEYFPSPADAKIALEKAETLSNFEQELLSGDLTKVLDSVKKENGESFNKIADNYLNSLSKVDERAYHHVVGNIIRSTIYNMVEQAKEMGEKNGEILKNTAAILNQFVFGTTRFQAAEPLSKNTPDKSDKERELEEKETKYKERQFNDAQSGLETRVEAILKHSIGKHIDPKQSMTPYVKRTAERDALETIYSLIERDSRFTTLKNKLWQYAEKNNFSAESIGRIRSAYLSKAETLLPSVIKKARNEALKGMGKRVREEVEEQQEEQEPKLRKSSSSDKSGRTTTQKRGEIPKGMSSKDFIMSD